MLPVAPAGTGQPPSSPKLDSNERWDRELSDDDQQCLALARVNLHKAPWIIIDEVLDVLDDSTLTRALDIFSKDLKGSGIVHIGRSDGHQSFSKTLHLVKDPAAKKLIPSAPVLALSH